MAFFHLGSMSDPSPALRTLNLGSSFFWPFWRAFHSSRVMVLGSTSSGALSSTASPSLASAGSPSWGASSTEVLVASSPSALTSSSKLPQFPLPLPPLFSSALIPVLVSGLRRRGLYNTQDRSRDWHRWTVRIRCE